MVTATETWKAAHPGAAVGWLIINKVTNPKTCPDLDRRREALEAELRASFPDRAAIKALPTIQAYTRYYKRFKKTYHVQSQVESVALKARNIPRVAALVEAMFMAELKSQLLTAGHDLAAVEPPLTVDSAQGGETYMGLSGRELSLKAGDMFMADVKGPISSVIYGPDRRTSIGPGTSRAMFVVYGPPGIGRPAIESHLDLIVANVRLISPQAEVESKQVAEAP
ncbi:MAG: hypothetical protein JRJ59_03515 [Deltaproteobacteria bacterium]|nr:hypothetical protein [Deltaproteobacteria bacterium]